MSELLSIVYIRKDYLKRCYSEIIKPIEKIKAEKEKNKKKKKVWVKN